MGKSGFKTPSVGSRCLEAETLALVGFYDISIKIFCGIFTLNVCFEIIYELSHCDRALPVNNLVML